MKVEMSDPCDLMCPECFVVDTLVDGFDQCEVSCGCGENCWPDECPNPEPELWICHACGEVIGEPIEPELQTL